MGVLGGGEGGCRDREAGLVEAVDGPVEAGWDESFFGLGFGGRGLVWFRWFGGRGGGRGDKWTDGWMGMVLIVLCLDVTYLFRVHEPDLARRHAGVFAQVRPRRVDDGHIVLFIACLNERKPSSVFSLFFSFLFLSFILS